MSAISTRRRFTISAALKNSVARWAGELSAQPGKAWCAAWMALRTMGLQFGARHYFGYRLDTSSCAIFGIQHSPFEKYR
jgi:hypothetical protein